VSTAAGERAIRGQMQRASQGAVNQGYSLAAGARGSSSPLALREAQRRGAMAQSDVAQQSGILQQQLQQGAAAQNAQMQMQAAQQNAAIQQANDAAMGKFVQGAAGAVAGGMISDERAKEAAYAAGLQAASAPQGPPVLRRGLVSPDMVPPIEAAPPPPAPDPQNAAEAAQYGAEWTRANNAALLEDLNAAGNYDLELAKQRDRLMYADRARANLLRATAYARGDSPDAWAPPNAPLPRATSDERAKDGMSFPDGVRPVAFRYRDGIEGTPGAPPGRHVGVLAQDLEKSPEGATVVHEDPRTGLKQVDTSQLSLLLTAKLAEMDAKLDKLGGKKRKGKRRA